MTKQEIVNSYINELKNNITRLQQDEQNDILEFYREFILDSDMNSENEIISELGTPKKLARKILADHSVTVEDDSANTKEEKQPKKENQMKTIWIIIIGLFAIPAAIPVAFALLGIVFGLFMAVFGIFLGFFGTIFGLVIGGIVLMGIAIATLFGSLPVGMLYLGIGIILTTIGLMLVPAAYYLIKILIDGITMFVRWVGRKFFNKQYYQSKEEK
ncbi:membrane protein [Companilactobacillus sp. RD055328]|uniref:DUF1700 domain-containing protein n=1 Tax=Companilactobacillus sp. RD055328 TaxID=2916634 RepID=UPI001FC8356F|nr:DUF1700 domain-containing protein [Companilactobacillus sp. RD055328]GKQ43214.1 membrane protein [Companilactobacillus sp. RD055328]